MDKQPLVQIDKLSKRFTIGSQTLYALSETSFTIAPGETLALAGESGCGKSTLAKALLRLIEPTTGAIYFEGVNLVGLDAKAMKTMRRRMQIIFQNPYASLNPRQRVEDIVGEAIDIHRLAKGAERKDRIEQLLQALGLGPDYLRRLPEELSGGQRQRVSIARALAVEPKFIVCDESLSALDMSTKVQLIDFLKLTQQEKNISYLFISHDLALLRHLAHRVAIMYLGSLVELAPSEILYTDPLHPYTQALLSAIPIPDPKQERQRSRIILKGEIPSPFTPPSGCPFHTRCPFAMPICKTSNPALKEVKPAHFVACHLQ